MEKTATPNGEASAKSLIEAVDRYLEAENLPYHRKVTGFHPSYTNPCIRFWVLIFEGAESNPKNNGRGYRIFHNGTQVHDRWQGYFKEMGILVQKEVPVTLDDPIPIRGHADAIIEWSGKKLIELKSINPDGFILRQIHKKPKDDHYSQIQQYMYGLDLDKGFIIYENKGTQDVLIFPVERDEDFLNKLIKKRKKIWELHKEGKRPARPYKRDSRYCTWCDLEQYCWDTLPD